MKEKNTQSTNEPEKVKFLSDKPLEADYKQNDRFGHSGIAENLKRIILTCPLPFTVGLFGKWGTGKTSILNILKYKLSTNNKIPVIVFDVWKHEGDAFRRTFLKEIVTQFQAQGLLAGYKLSERVDTSISVKKKMDKIDKITAGVATALIAIMIVIGIFLWIWDKNTFQQYFSIVASGSLVTALLIWLFNRIIITEDLTRSQDRFTDPHEFERQFLEIIKASKAQRLLVAIDNLDRCTQEHAINMLATIKTFLANDSDRNCCIFLITCDDKAIKKHLEKVYDKPEEGFNNADEFLRKFFNVSLTLPDFIDTELHNYTKEMLTQTMVPQFDNPDVAHVIITAFRDNPRQIKQFINMLIAHFLLAQNRENETNPMIVPKGAITDNVAFLAKFLVIRQKFFSVYQEISSRFLPPDEWKNLKDINFKKFHTATNIITVRDVRPFIYLKQSEEELRIPGLRQVERGLVENNIGLLVDSLSGFKTESEKMKYFNIFLLDLLRRYQNEKATLINIFECSLAASNKVKIELDKQFYRQLGHLLNDPDSLQNNLFQFSPNLIFSELLIRCGVGHKNNIIEHYVEYFCLKRDEKDTTRIGIDPHGEIYSIGRDYACEILKDLVKSSDLTDRQKERIRETIENSCYNDIEFLSLFEDDIQKQTDFISETTLAKYVSAFTVDDVNNIELISRKTHLVLKFKEIIKEQATENILAKFQDLLDAQNKIPLKQAKAAKENLFLLTEEILSDLNNIIRSDNVKETLNLFADKLSDGFNSLNNWDDRKIIIFSCLLVADLLEEVKEKNIKQLIKGFFANASLTSIQYVFDNKRFQQDQKSELINQYVDEFKNRAIADQSIFDFLYLLASGQVRSDWLVGLINSHPNRAIEKLNQLKYKTDDDKEIVNALLQKATKLSITEKAPIYNVINEMKCADDDLLKNTLSLQIEDLLKTTDEASQELGYKVLNNASLYLSGVNKREIGTEVIEWLRSPSLSNAYQWNSIKSVLLSWGVLPSPAKESYIYFVFNKIIIPKKNIDTIRFGFQILKEVQIEDEGDNQKYFEDTFSSIENEQREDVKKETMAGLICFKPENPKKERRVFWNKVDELNSIILPKSPPTV